MIKKEYNLYIGECDICFEETEEFDNWHDCKDSMKNDGWRFYFNEKTKEWEHLCPNCKNLK